MLVYHSADCVSIHPIVLPVSANVGQTLFEICRLHNTAVKTCDNTIQCLICTVNKISWPREIHLSPKCSFAIDTSSRHWFVNPRRYVVLKIIFIGCISDLAFSCKLFIQWFYGGKKSAIYSGVNCSITFASPTFRIVYLSCTTQWPSFDF